MKGYMYAIFITSGILSIASLSYSFVIIRRLVSNSLSGTHIGGDVIFLAYITPIVAFILAIFGWKISDNKPVKTIVLMGSFFALLVWLYLHWSRKVFSHSSMFN